MWSANRWRRDVASKAPSVGKLEHSAESRGPRPAVPEIEQELYPALVEGGGNWLYDGDDEDTGHHRGNPGACVRSGAHLRRWIRSIVRSADRSAAPNGPPRLN